MEKRHKPLKMNLQFFAEKKGAAAAETESHAELKNELEEREQQLADLANQLKETNELVKELQKDKEDREAQEEARTEMEELEKEAYQRAKKRRDMEKQRETKKAEALNRMTADWESRLDRMEKIFIPDGPRLGNLPRQDRELVKMLHRGGGSLEFGPQELGAIRKQLTGPQSFEKATLTTGPNWDPTIHHSDIVAAVAALTPVSGALRQRDMTAGTVVMPTRPNAASAGKATEGQTMTENANTLRGSSNLVAEKIGTWVDISTEESEDAIAAALPEIKQAIAEGLAEQMETQVIQGLDGTGGMVKDAGVTIPALTDPPTDIKWISRMMTAMGKWGVNPMNLVFICSPEVYGLIREDDNVISVDRYGPRASIITGEVAKVFGMPVLVTDFLPTTDSEATPDGIPEYATLICHRDAAVRGMRRNVTLKTDEDVKSDVLTIAGTVRTAYAALHPAGIALQYVEV